MKDITFLKNLNTQRVIEKKYKLTIYKQELVNIRELLNNTHCDIELRRLRPMNINRLANSGAKPR